MPMGSATRSSGSRAPVTPFTAEIRKSAYLKYSSRPTETQQFSTSIRRGPKRSVSRPAAHAVNATNTISRTYTGSPNA